MTDLIEIKQLKKYFPIHRGVLLSRHVGDVRAVDGVDLNIRDQALSGLSVNRDAGNRRWDAAS